jgi:hypothetical protein
MMKNSDASIGLCAGCRYHSVVRSAKGKVFHLCEYAMKDLAYPKYPALPVNKCLGFSSAKHAKNREEK